MFWRTTPFGSWSRYADIRVFAVQSAKGSPGRPVSARPIYTVVTSEWKYTCRLCAIGSRILLENYAGPWQMNLKKQFWRARNVGMHTYMIKYDQNHSRHWRKPIRL
jgi:hypothetical protein